MSNEVDFTGVEPKRGGGGFGDPVAEGIYSVTITEAKAPKSTTPGVNVKFEIDGGAEAGRWLWDTIWLSPKSLPFARQKLESCGYAVPAGKLSVDTLIDGLVGRRCMVTVEHRPDRQDPDKMRAQVTFWDPPGSIGGGDFGAFNAPSVNDDTDIPF